MSERAVVEQIEDAIRDLVQHAQIRHAVALAVVASLELTEEWSLKHAQGRKPERDQASAVSDAAETNARYAKNHHYRNATATAERRFVSSWLPR